MPKNDDTQYLDLDSLSPEEREVFDLAMAGLTLPRTARHEFFLEAARDLKRTTGALARRGH